MRCKSDSPRTICIITVSHVSLAQCIRLRRHVDQTITYGVMIRVAFSPSVMGDASAEPRMPSSHPVHERQSPCRSRFAECIYTRYEAGWFGQQEHTFDNSACADGSNQVTPTYRSIESEIQSMIRSIWSPKRELCRVAYCPPLWSGASSSNNQPGLSLDIDIRWYAGLTSVFHRDFIVFLRVVYTVARLNNELLYAHTAGVDHG